MAVAAAAAALSFRPAPEGFTRLSPRDAEQLRSVFFGGEPWLVQCASSPHEVLRLTAARKDFDFSLALLDCDAKLPSGKSTIERFRLDRAISPVLVLFANNQAPLQVTPSSLSLPLLFPSPQQHADALAAFVRERSTPKALAFSTSAQLHAKCVASPRHCLLALSPHRPHPLLARLLPLYRTFLFATIDTSKYELSLAKHLPPPLNGTDGKPLPQLLALHASPPPKSKAKPKPKPKGGGVALAAKAHRGEWTLEAVRSFLDELREGKLEMAPLKKAPQLRRRQRSPRASKGSSRDTSKGRVRRGRAESGKTKAAAGKAAKSEGEGAQRESEVERRRKMAEEEAAALRGMFAEEEGEEEEEEEEESLDLDEEEEEASSDEAGSEDSFDSEKEEL